LTVSGGFEIQGGHDFFVRLILVRPVNVKENPDRLNSFAAD
jgi:hypothetical protein